MKKRSKKATHTPAKPDPQSAAVHQPSTADRLIPYYLTSSTAIDVEILFGRLKRMAGLLQRLEDDECSCGDERIDVMEFIEHTAEQLEQIFDMGRGVAQIAKGGAM